MGFFSRFCLCWERKERLDEGATDEDIGAAGGSHETARGQTAIIDSDQEASPERVKRSLPYYFSRLKFWDKRKALKNRVASDTEGEQEWHEKYEEEEHRQQHSTYKEGNLIADNIDYGIHQGQEIQETSRDSLETIIL